MFTESLNNLAATTEGSCNVILSINVVVVVVVVLLLRTSLLPSFTLRLSASYAFDCLGRQPVSTFIRVQCK